MKKLISLSLVVATIISVNVAGALAYGTPGPAAPTSCDNAKPQKAWLYRVANLGKGKYQLYWDKADRATSWTIGYGTEPGKYIYGIHNFGDSNSRNLVINTASNKKFYFVVRANNGCTPGDWSNEWKGSGGVVVSSASTKPLSIKAAPQITPTTNKPNSITPPTQIPQQRVTEKPVNQTPVPVVTPAPKKQGFIDWIISLFK